jgi:hypothetical protein
VAPQRKPESLLAIENAGNPLKHDIQKTSPKAKCQQLIGLTKLNGDTYPKINKTLIK